MLQLLTGEITNKREIQHIPGPESWLDILVFCLITDQLRWARFSLLTHVGLLRISSIECDNVLRGWDSISRSTRESFSASPLFHISSSLALAISTVVIKCRFVVQTHRSPVFRSSKYPLMTALEATTSSSPPPPPPLWNLCCTLFLQGEDI